MTQHQQAVALHGGAVGEAARGGGGGGARQRSQKHAARRKIKLMRQPNLRGRARDASAEAAAAKKRAKQQVAHSLRSAAEGSS